MADEIRNNSAEADNGGSGVRIDAIREAVAAPQSDHAAAADPAQPQSAPADAEGAKGRSSGKKSAAGNSPAPKGRVAKAKTGKKAASAGRNAAAEQTRAAITSRKSAGRTSGAANRTIDELKETIMATKADTQTSPTDFASGMQAGIQNASTEMQERMKTIFEKSSAMSGELTETARGNVEAVVESTRILATGMQSMSRDAVEGSREAFEGMTADLKKMAAVKSPSELFRLQGELARRNLDAMIGLSSRNTESMVKLVNDAFAPISNRMSITAEKMSQAA
ncbi:phasin family protein [Pseudopontixanthobacter vadosimaris]|uniref:phasin family protein n=1 Tax=Pseudopontixanthobacter vadosimaris TaxID=2726450 RepID=UPI0014742CEF|nr:phasin family protein [Pseudopontixanthobacter vadosimaris]